MKLPLRIAILECDDPPDGAKKKLGGYGSIFRTLLDASANSLGHPGLSAKEGLELTYWHVMNETYKYPDPDEVDAILITGSRHDSFANDTWILTLVEYTKMILAQDRVKIIGVCFGHQIVGRALGAPVGRSDGGWETSVVPLQLTGTGKRIFQRDGIRLFQMHRDAVSDYPAGVEELGSTDRCTNHGMYIEKRLITVQGHPEFTKDIMEEILETRVRIGVIPPDIYDDGMARLKDHDDGVIVGQAFLRFLLDS